MNEIEPSQSARDVVEGRLGCAASVAALDCAGKLACDASPLPLATNRVWLSGLTATAVGYHPTGMNPSTTGDSRCAASRQTLKYPPP